MHFLCSVFPPSINPWVLGLDLSIRAGRVFPDARGWLVAKLFAVDVAGDGEQDLLGWGYVSG